MTRSHTARAADGSGDEAAGGRRRGGVRTAAAVTLSALVLLIAGSGWLYLQLNGDIATFGADGLSRDRPAAGAGGSNVLVIGSDSRAGGNRKLGGGEDGVGRSDTAFLLHVHGDGRHALAVSIPRDTLVDIPPCRLPDGGWTPPRPAAMFNSAFTVGNTPKGNPACTQNTVEHLTGLRVDHTVVVDFAGFADLTTAVGGVPVCLPRDVYEGDLDPHLGTRGRRVFAKGPQTVSGQRALDYVRLRHGLGDGSDIGRIKRQQAFVGALIKKVKSQGMSPGKLLPLAKAATAALTVDPGLGSADRLLAFALSMKNIELRDTKFLTVPWRYQGARVAIVHPDADELWAALRADRTVDGQDAGAPAGPSTGGDGKHPAAPAPAGPPPATVAVAVYNGTTVPGLAAHAAGELRAAGFTVTRIATAATQQHTATVIGYGPGRQDQAQAVAQHFPGAVLQQTTAPGVTVTLGRTYADGPVLPGAATPSPPAHLGGAARTADDDPCADLSYG
ncbi:transcriptional regulator [Streptomyces sp. NRRL F-4489]|uniref:LCP family protein n=1 Tax=Streptomyces sp. NRRL F-4489 TaxID=1609095 RepID=UPI000749D040|nr:LCP family protein [Streptomyces sp. NRRL F-4489]KUL37881.1 transcriptional regulator [Streptomyces sp. NRRL F-4489]